MKQEYWFKPKKYGYGFHPISFQGWIMTALLIGLIFLSAYINEIFSNYVLFADVARFFLDIVFLIGIFSYFAEKKLNGELKWRWGEE